MVEVVVYGLFFLMSCMSIGTSILYVYEIWKYERCLAHRLGLTAMVLGMACAGVLGVLLVLTF